MMRAKYNLTAKKIQSDNGRVYIQPSVRSSLSNFKKITLDLDSTIDVPKIAYGTNGITPMKI